MSSAKIKVASKNHRKKITKIPFAFVPFAKNLRALYG
jgi:hypothetical protein